MPGLGNAAEVSTLSCSETFRDRRPPRDVAAFVSRPDLAAAAAGDAVPAAALPARQGGSAALGGTSRHRERARPPGPLVWIHAASVGEATAVLRLIERLLETRPELEILLTTGTVASARLLESRLPARARHQYVPVDLPGWIRRFLDHWRPDLALWVESELWPNLVLATHARGIPMMLLNGRLSARSYRRWRRWPGLIGPMLGAFAQCLAQDAEQARRLRRLGGDQVTAIGDLKAAGNPLPVDPARIVAIAAGDRPAAAVARSQHASRRGGDRRGGAPTAGRRSSRSVDDHRAAPSRSRRSRGGDAGRARAERCTTQPG